MRETLPTFYSQFPIPYSFVSSEQLCQLKQCQTAASQLTAIADTTKSVVSSPLERLNINTL